MERQLSGRPSAWLEGEPCSSLAFGYVSCENVTHTYPLPAPLQHVLSSHPSDLLSPMTRPIRRIVVGTLFKLRTLRCCVRCRCCCLNRMLETMSFHCPRVSSSDNFSLILFLKNSRVSLCAIVFTTPPSNS